MPHVSVIGTQGVVNTVAKMATMVICVTTRAATTVLETSAIETMERVCKDAVSALLDQFVPKVFINSMTN